MHKRYLLILLLLVSTPILWGQSFSTEFSYESPKTYTIAHIRVDGVKDIDPNLIIGKTGLQAGQNITIPGSEITEAVKTLWKGNDFGDVQIVAEKIQGKNIYLLIKLVEHERLTSYSPAPGISKSHFEDINEQLNLYSGMLITDELINKINRIARGYYIDKGYFKATSSVELLSDTILNGKKLLIKIKKGERFKINAIHIEGNEALTDTKIKRQMKDTKERKWYKLFIGSKFNHTTYNNDKQNIIDKYNDLAYRDAEITSDTIYDYDERTINIDMKINEGNKYYIRSITWTGNVKYRSGQLDTVLGVQAGDEYNKSTLDTRLYMNPNGNDVSSLYMDDGYLFFQITPVEKNVSNDSVDLELRIYEGKQARIKNITVVGNTKTSDHVIIRDLYTKPGDLFSRDAVIRSQRELSQKGYFNPETLGVNPIPNPADGTVDIEYNVEESPNDRVELSGGFGAGRIVGTLGVSFNNFSLKRMFKKGAWSPVPSGDGQRLSVRAQSNGYWYQSYNLSFTEPWLGGKKPNSLSVNAFHSVQAQDPFFLKGEDGKNVKDDQGKKIPFPDRRFVAITGLAVGLGKRLKWPDDYFSIYHELSYQYYKLNNFGSVFSFSDGYANNLSYRFSLSRSSIDQPLYPRTGSSVTLSVKTTLPYSFFDGINDYSNRTEQENNKWLEYNKIKFTTSWFAPLSKDKKLILNARFGVGLLNAWNPNKGVTPFERFYMGGSGLTGFNIDGREIIALRGYEDGTISPQTGGRLISKYTMELRYPLSLNPSATVYLLGFAEAGNTWDNYKDFNPLKVKRSAGVGVRVFLPMFGLLGLDYGWGFDPVDNPQTGDQINVNSSILDKGYFGKLHFTIGMNLGEL